MSRYQGIGLTTGPRVGINRISGSEHRVKLLHPSEPLYSVTLYRSITKARCEEEAQRYAVLLGLNYIGETGIKENA